MTQEEKQLLLKDLCARLLYGVIVNVNGNDERVDEINPFEGIITCGFQSFDINECKPYLRPMSSMTEEEREELSRYENSIQRTDFYYSHHIDCRYMIEKGLALEAPKDMYE